MRDQIKKNIPGVGIVTFVSVKTRVIKEALSKAKQVESQEKATVFSNHVLVNMIIDPKMTFEDINNLSNDNINEVIEIAVDILKIRYYYNSNPGKEARERFYTAFTYYFQKSLEDLSKNIYESLGAINLNIERSFTGIFSKSNLITSSTDRMIGQLKSISMMGSIADFKWPDIDISTWEKAFKLSDKIAKTAQLSIDKHITLYGKAYKAFREIDEKMRGITAGFSAVRISIEQFDILGVFSNLINQVQVYIDAEEAFRMAGWPIAPSMQEELISEVVNKYKQGRKRFISITIIGYYQKNGNKNLIDAVEAWNNNKLFAPRMRFLKDALNAHCKGLYTLSVPAVVSQIEGILSDYVVANNLAAKLGKIKEIYEAAIGDEQDYDLSKWIIASTLLHLLKNNIYCFKDFEDEIKLAINSRSITRHTVSHGILLNYDKPMHSLKMFLLLDAVSVLRDQ